jgi:hypothetical protein
MSDRVGRSNRGLDPHQYRGLAPHHTELLRMANGFVVWEGESCLDGAPIVLIVIGFSRKSTNRKTGGMLQSYILRRDVSPLEAVRIGLDPSVCGDCPHRSTASGGEGSCYVNMTVRGQCIPAMSGEGKGRYLQRSVQMRSVIVVSVRGSEATEIPLRFRSRFGDHWSRLLHGEPVTPMHGEASASSWGW